MFEKYFEQSERFFRPMNEIWALQAQAAESISRTNGALMSEVWQGGLTLAQSLTEQKSLDEALKLQKSYWDNVTQKVQQVTEENQTLLTDFNQKVAGVMQNTSLDDVVPDVGAPVRKSKTPAGSAGASASSASSKSNEAKKPSAQKSAAPAKKSPQGDSNSHKSAKPAASHAKADTASKSASDGKSASTKAGDGKAAHKSADDKTAASKSADSKHTASSGHHGKPEVSKAASGSSHAKASDHKAHEKHPGGQGKAGSH